MTWLAAAAILYALYVLFIRGPQARALALQESREREFITTIEPSLEEYVEIRWENIEIDFATMTMSHYASHAPDDHRPTRERVVHVLHRTRDGEWYARWNRDVVDRQDASLVEKQLAYSLLGEDTPSGDSAELVKAVAHEWVPPEDHLVPLLDVEFERCVRWFSAHPGVVPGMTVSAYVNLRAASGSIAEPRERPSGIAWSPPMHATDDEVELSFARIQPAVRKIYDSPATPVLMRWRLSKYVQRSF